MPLCGVSPASTVLSHADNIYSYRPSKEFLPPDVLEAISDTVCKRFFHS
jgi:hypothetical protein